MKHDILFIEHQDYGQEQFQIKNPRYNYYKDEDGTWEFVIKANTDSALLRVKNLEEVIDAQPNIEATAVVYPSQLKFKTGQVIFQKEGYDHHRDEYLSNIYYFEHETIEKFEFEILEIHQGYILGKMTGEAIINGSNGSDPDAKLALITKFVLDKTLQRDIG